MSKQLAERLRSDNQRWKEDEKSGTYCWQPGPAHHSPPISFTTTSGGLCTLSMLCSWWLLQPGHTPLPPFMCATKHTPLPPFMCATKQSMQIIYPHKVSWIGRFRMFVQLGHWKLAREVLDAAVWNRIDIHSDCTTWKPTGAMVSRCFQTVCAAVPWVTTVLPLLLGSSTHWLLTEYFTHITAISRKEWHH